MGAGTIFFAYIGLAKQHHQDDRGEAHDDAEFYKVVHPQVGVWSTATATGAATPSLV